MFSVTVSKVSGALLLSLPDWVPQSARNYSLHTEKGGSIRELVRDLGCHASTVNRQVKRLERRREDKLVDEALRSLGATGQAVAPKGCLGQKSTDIAVRVAEADICTDDAERTARRAAFCGGWLCRVLFWLSPVIWKKPLWYALVLTGKPSERQH